MQKLSIGIFWKLISCAAFAGINAFVRFLSGGSKLALTSKLSISSIMLYQNLVGAIVILPWLIIRHQPLAHKVMPRWHLIRALTATIGVQLWYISLKHIPIPQVIALGFLSPIITILGAYVFLKEQLNLEKTLAVATGLVGSFFILKPYESIAGAFSYGWYSWLPVLAALIFAFDKLITKKLISAGESSGLLAWYLMLFAIPACFAMDLYQQPAMLHTEHLLPIFVLGLLTAMAHYSFAKAYEYAEVTVLMPFGVAKLLVAGLISYLVFNEYPNNFNMCLGIIILTLSAVILSTNSIDFLKKKLSNKWSAGCMSKKETL